MYGDVLKKNTYLSFREIPRVIRVSSLRHIYMNEIMKASFQKSPYISIHTHQRLIRLK